MTSLRRGCRVKGVEGKGIGSGDSNEKKKKNGTERRLRKPWKFSMELHRNDEAPPRTFHTSTVLYSTVQGI